MFPSDASHNDVEGGLSYKFYMFSSKAHTHYLTEVLGVSSLVLSSEKSQQGAFPSPQARVLFVFEAESEQETELLKKMIEAMGLSEGDYQKIQVRDFKLAKSLFESAQKINPIVTVVFGDATFKEITGASNSKESFGKFYDASGRVILPSHSLKELVFDPSKKKSTWQHLKLVMERINS